MRLRTKIYALMAVPVAILIVTVAFAFQAERSMSSSLQRVEHTYMAKESLAIVFDDLVDAETGMRGYLLTGDLNFLEPYTQASSSLESDLDDLGSLIQDNESQALRERELRILSYERLRVLSTLRLFAPITETRDPDRVDPILQNGQVIMDEIRVLVAALEAEENRLLDLRHLALERARHVAFLVETVALPLSLVFGLVSVFVFTRRLAGRLGSIERNAARLEEGRPLDPPEDVQDEIGDLSRAFAESAERISTLQSDLRHLAAVDPLTQLSNRRGFLPIAEHQLRVAQRSREPMALIFMDVDGLKHVNDTLGHAAGDALLAEAASVLRTTFRSSDLPARLGGDEFCVLIRGGSAASADRAVERLQEAVADANRMPDRTFELSLSVGIAHFDPDETGSLDRLIERADALMYADKRAKRGLAPAV